MFAGLPFLWPFRAGPTPPPTGQLGRHGPLGQLSTGQNPSCSSQPVDNRGRHRCGMYNLCITLFRLNIIDVVLSRPMFLLGLTLMRKLVSAHLRVRVVAKNFGVIRTNPSPITTPKVTNHPSLACTSTTLLSSARTRCLASLSASMTLMRVSVTATSMRSPYILGLSLDAIHLRASTCIRFC